MLLFSHSVMFSSLRPCGLQHARLPCPSLAPGACSDSSIESMMPSNDLILCHPLLLLPSNFPSIGVFSNESAVSIGWPKYWRFSFSISPSNEYSGLISFRIDWFYLLAVKGSLRSPPAPQFESINSSVFSLLYSLTLKSIHYQWKNNSFAYTEVCWQRSI